MEKGIEEWKMVGNSLKIDQHFSREGRHRKDRHDPIIEALPLKMHVKKEAASSCGCSFGFF